MIFRLIRIPLMHLGGTLTKFNQSNQFVDSIEQCFGLF